MRKRGSIRCQRNALHWLSQCLPATEKLQHESSDLRSERMMSVKCGHPDEGER